MALLPITGMCVPGDTASVVDVSVVLVRGGEEEPVPTAYILKDDRIDIAFQAPFLLKAGAKLHVTVTQDSKVSGLYQTVVRWP